MDDQNGGKWDNGFIMVVDLGFDWGEQIGIIIFHGRRMGSNPLWAPAGNQPAMAREPSYGMAQSLPPVEPAEEIERLRIDFVWDIWDQFLTPQRWQLGHTFCWGRRKQALCCRASTFGVLLTVVAAVETILRRASSAM